MKKNYFKLFKKFMLFAAVIIVFTWAGSVFIVRYKIRSAEKRYYRDYVKIINYDFNKYKQNATINVAIENFGKRLLDSINVKIDYYDTDGKLLGTDLSDILKMSKDSLYPESGKVFRIDVTCSEETTEIKLSIN
ncbi:MAG: hypothetical protein ABH954_05665 [Candidatus Omnitrophota bacterium]